MRQYVGIDPGKQGGIAVLTEGRTTYLQLSKHDDASIFRFLRDKVYETAVICFEQVNVFKRDGAKSATTFMKEAGKLQGYLIALGLEAEFVAPTTWQPMFRAGSNKEINLAIAQMLGLANEATPLEVGDSILLAEYARRISRNPSRGNSHG
jgi:hypothetical protein